MSGRGTKAGMKDLESRVRNDSNWLRRAFKEERSTMGNHLAASIASIGMAACFSYYAPQFFHSDAIISGIATTCDIGGYWAVLLPQLLYKDRYKLNNNEGKLDRKKVVRKFGEYLTYAGIFEGFYIIGRFFGQYKLQKEGFDPAVASVIIQLSGTVFLTAAFPPLRYAVRQWSEK